MLRKILAVDDSALIHQMYKLFLSRYKSCKLVSAMNGLEAQERGVEESEVLASVLEVDADQLGGDLGLHHRAGDAPPGLTGS